MAYSYKLKDKWESFVGFQKSPYNFYALGYDIFKNKRIGGRNYLLTQNYGRDEDIGKVLDRHDANMFDLGVRYLVYKKSAHSIKAEIGLSANYVLNSYLINIVRSPLDSTHIMFVSTKEKRDWYFGGLVGLRYDYTFWKDRMNVGVYTKARAYSGGFPFQINYGLQIGYNF